MRLLTFLLVSSIAFAANIPTTNVKRSLIADTERRIDKRLDLVGLDDPLLVLGQTRGVYLDGYGIVFTTELNLLATANISPFRPSYTKEELQRIRLKKAVRLEALKKNMRDILITTGASLDTVPPAEKVAIGITLFYFSWEDSAGLPRQLVISAPRKALIAALKGETTLLDETLRLQELN